MAKTWDDINDRISSGRAVVVTAEEIIPMAEDLGVSEVARRVDVVTTGTFGPMCSSGAFLSFGHADPPIKMTRVLLSGVPAYPGIAAVDTYIGAAEPSSDGDIDYGGAHVIEDLVSGRPVSLEAWGAGTDCYPRRRLSTILTLDRVNQAYLYNPRNAYQNYVVAANTSDRTLHTYMGVLPPRLGAITYSSAGQLSPLLNDPHLRTVGIGSRVFLGGGVGYVAGEGTQHNPGQRRNGLGIPVAPAAALALTGDLKAMTRRYLRACRMKGYGPSLYVGIGVAIPMLDEDMVRSCAVSDADIGAEVVDYSVGRRSRPVLGTVSYAQLRAGTVSVAGTRVRAVSLSSYHRAREIALVLKDRVARGDFTLTRPVAPLPESRAPQPLEEVERC